MSVYFFLIIIIFFLLSLIVYNYSRIKKIKNDDEAELKKIAVMEKEIQKIKNELIKSMRVKNDFLSVISHELRTPLANIKEGVSLVLDEVAGSVNETQRKFLNLALININRLSHLIYDILDLSKIEAGRIRLKRKTYDFRLIIKDVYKAMYAEAEKKFITFDVNLPDKPLESYLDQSKFTQVVTNLVDNAIKFTSQEGQISLDLKEKNGYISFSIFNSGRGIPDTEISRVFEKFYHGRYAGGTGLGLAITKGIIELHRGMINVESEKDKGTKFVFTLPIVSPPTILIVDDEKHFVQALEVLLEEENYNVEIAFDGDEALEIIRATLPSLILLDIKMPRMNGYEVIEYLMKDEKTKYIPIVIISGYEIDTARLRKMGMKKIRSLSKPIDNDVLLEEIEMILSSSP